MSIVGCTQNKQVTPNEEKSNASDSLIDDTTSTCAIERTANLNAYYPEYTRIDLVCGQMPKTSQKNVVFCCEAAFTGELLKEFKHRNIADNHICNGEMKKGFRCKTNTEDLSGKKGNGNS